MKKTIYMTIAVIAACLGLSSCDDMPHYTDLPHIEYNPEAWVESSVLQDSTVTAEIYVTSAYPVEYITYSQSSLMTDPVRADYDVDQSSYHFILTGLLPATTYYYVVYANYNGYALTSGVFTFTTPEYVRPTRELSIAELNMQWWDGQNTIGDILRSSVYAAFRPFNGNYMQFGNSIFNSLTGTVGSPWTFTLNTPVTVSEGDSGDVVFGAAWKGFNSEGYANAPVEVNNSDTWPYRGLSEYSYTYPAMSVNIRCPLALVTINFTSETDMTIQNVQLWNDQKMSLYATADYNLLYDTFKVRDNHYDIIGGPLVSYSTVKLSPQYTSTVQFVVIPQELTAAPQLYYETSAGGQFVPLPITSKTWDKYSTTTYECSIAADNTVTLEVVDANITTWTDGATENITVK